MSYTRRTFLVGATSGLSVLVLTACADDNPAPVPTVTPTTSVDDIPLATSFHRSTWATDPYSLGATSYLSVAALPQSRETLAQPVLDRIYLAGEAISTEPGTIRGAIASGRSAAQRLAKELNDGERVAVIGAGAAGSAAAEVLAAYGADVVVVEARDRTGGRVASYVEGDENFFELGAWRLSGDDASIIDALAREGVEVAPLAGASAYALLTDTVIAELEADDPAIVAVDASLDAASAWAQQQAADVSVADAVREGGTPDSWPAAAVTSDVLLDQLLLSVAGLTGADADQLSAWFSDPAPADGVVVPTGALSSFVDASLDGIDTLLSTAVSGVFYNDDGVSLRLGTGESLSVDRVVITVPLGVLQKQVVEFDPPLPVAHRGAINALSVGHVEVVRLEFESAFWNTEAVWWVNETADEPIRLWVNLLPATGRPVLLGVVGGESALQLAKADDATVRESARRSLAPFAAPSV